MGKKYSEMSLKEKLRASEATTKYVKTHLRRFEVRLNVEKDKELIDHILSKENIQAYLKELIIKDIEKK